MKINTIGHLVKTNPIQTQYKPNQTQLKPISMTIKPNSNPNKPNFKKEEYMVICSQLLAAETQYPTVLHRKVEPTVGGDHTIKDWRAV
jgi:hypothetical protein